MSNIELLAPYNSIATLSSHEPSRRNFSTNRANLLINYTPLQSLLQFLSIKLNQKHNNNLSSDIPLNITFYWHTFRDMAP